MPRKRNNSSRLFDSQFCAFCGTDDNNELLYGKFVVAEDISFHDNCMFFASGLSQRENEEVGFYGFVLSDIEVELRRGKKLNCFYCHRKGATIGCCEVKCKKSFHFPCGLLHDSLHQFFDSFASYCKTHAPKQKTVAVSESLICHICCEKITTDILDMCLYSPCCKNSWFHKMCLQKYALSAGLYFFKCPLCNNSTEFIKEMQMHGISIPDKDAAWELEENAFQDLLMKPGCDALICLCPKGRNYCPKKTSGWTLLSCSYCGYHARHKNCEKMKSSDDFWICSECTELEKSISKKKNSQAVVKDDNNILPVSSMSCSPSTSSTSPLVYSKYSVHNTCDAKLSTPVMKNISNDIDSMSLLTPRKTDISISSNIKSDSVKVCLTRMKLPISSFGVSLVPCIEKSKPVDDKQLNFKDVKNLSHSSVASKININKGLTNRKVTKKQKLDNCCNSPEHRCIKKYFGQECGKFRI